MIFNSTIMNWVETNRKWSHSQMFYLVIQLNNLPSKTIYINHLCNKCTILYQRPFYTINPHNFNSNNRVATMWRCMTLSMQTNKDFWQIRSKLCKSKTKFTRDICSKSLSLNAKNVIKNFKSKPWRMSDGKLSLHNSWSKNDKLNMIGNWIKNRLCSGRSRNTKLRSKKL